VHAEKGKRLKILIAEDNYTTARIMEFVLKKEGYETVWAGSGLEALEELRFDPKIACVVTDILMPEMDGIAMLIQMKKDPVLKSIPVIVCTGYSDIKQIKTAIANGCEHILVKPFQPSDLIVHVKEAINKEAFIIKPETEIMSKFALEPNVFQEILSDFRKELEIWTNRLESGYNITATEPKNSEFDSVLESAKVFGAQKLVEALIRFKNGEKVEEALPKVLIEMQTVIAALDKNEKEEEGEEKQEGQEEQATKSS
jgi:CheY-like chemotaxis protein